MLDTSVMFFAATPASVRPGFRPTRGSVVDGFSGPACAESTAGTAAIVAIASAVAATAARTTGFHRNVLWLNGTDGRAPDHRLPSMARMRSISMR